MDSSLRKQNEHDFEVLLLNIKTQGTVAGAELSKLTDTEVAELVDITARLHEWLNLA